MNTVRSSSTMCSMLEHIINKYGNKNHFEGNSCKWIYTVKHPPDDDLRGKLGQELNVPVSLETWETICHNKKDNSGSPSLEDFLKLKF